MHGLKHASGDYVLLMDADMSHHVSTPDLSGQPKKSDRLGLVELHRHGSSVFLAAAVKAI